MRTDTVFTLFDVSLAVGADCDVLVGPSPVGHGGGNRDPNRVFIPGDVPDIYGEINAHTTHIHKSYTIA